MRIYFLIIYSLIQLIYEPTLNENDDINKSHSFIKIENCDSLSILKRAELLKMYFSKFPDSIAKKSFYNCFPKNFDDFKSIFGYEDLSSTEAIFGPLYEKSQDYIDAFFLKLNVKQVQLTESIIDIAMNGNWQADGVNIFQLYLQENLTNNLEIYVKLLKRKSENIINGFWHFYFDGPCPENYKEDYKLLYIELQKLDPKIAILMKQSYERLLKEHNKHGN